MRKKIYIPHLNYTIYVRPFNNPPDGILKARAYAEHIDEHSCAIYIPPKELAPDLAHEIIHVLQYICIDRNMEFTLEREHMGYLMQYIMGQVLGYKWK